MPKFEGTDDRGEIKTTHKVNVGRTCSGVTKVPNTLKKGNKGNKLLVMVKICKRIKEKNTGSTCAISFYLTTTAVSYLNYQNK